MKEETKKRIDAIRRGEVPENYVRTEYGVFPDHWRFAELREIAQPITETAGVRIIETVSISAGVGFVNQAEKFGKELSGKQYEKYTVLHQGDFSYNKGNSNQYPQGCIYRLNDREVAAVPNVFESFRIVEGDPDYYEQLFLSGFLNHQLFRKINHGVRDDGLLNLTEKDFYSCVLPVPPIEEQHKIARVLSSCDQVICLHQKVLSEMKQMKRTFLSKLFPNAGNLYPELRFHGFTDTWEQRKLKDAFDILQNNTLSRADLSLESGVAKNIHYGDVLIKYGEYTDASEAALPYIPSQQITDKYKSSVLKDGDIIMADTAEDETVGKCTEIANLQGFPTISGLHTIPLRPKDKFAKGFLG